MLHSHQVTFLPPVHTQEPLRSQSCAARRLWVEAGHMTGFSVCTAGWVTVEVRGSLFSTAPSHSSKQQRVWWAALRGMTRKRCNWLQCRLALPFPLHPEGRQSLAKIVKQGAHCDINTQRGRVRRCELQRRSLWGWDESVCRGGVGLVQEVSKSRTKAFRWQSELSTRLPLRGRNTPEKHFAYKHLVLQL